MNADSLRQLIANCRNKKMRYVGFPCDWQPQRVRNSNLLGLYLTDAAAWEVVAVALESGHAYQEIVLDTPKGAPALVLLLNRDGDSQPVYVKIQVGVRNTPIGRSFHYSDKY